MNNIQSFLSTVAEKNNLIREEKRKNAQTEVPDFSLLEIINPNISEMHLSKMIAFLLNPKGKHEQGALYLNAFLEKLGMPSWLSKDSIAQADIKLEQRIKDKRRIDIYIKFPNGTVAIENKPWAEDQRKQLSDYATHLKSLRGEDGNWLLVYLCNEEPEESSISEKEKQDYKYKKHFIEFKFTEFNEVLYDCLNLTLADPIKIFIKGLIKYISKRINREPDMNIKKATYESIIANEESIVAAFDVSQSIDLAKFKLLDKLREQLIDIIKDSHPNWQLEWNISSKFQIWEGFGIKLASDHDLHVRFEFRDKRLGNFQWGIKCHNNEYIKDRNEEIWKSVFEKFSEYYPSDGTDCTKRWPWITNNFSVDFQSEKLSNEFDNSMRNWDKNPNVWKLIIKNKAFANQLISIVADVENKIMQNPELCFTIKNITNVD